jgi:L-ascorbate metabolism protein UlaG (beta-lactamase superfamily)
MALDRITYVGHGTVLVELAGVRLLTDPVLRERMAPLMRRQVPPPDPDVVKRIDAVLISHLHHDHFDIPSMRMVGDDVPLIVPAGAGRTVRRRGFKDVSELRPAERTHVGGLEITATPAVHDGRRYKVGPKVEAAGYTIEGGGRRIYFAGDTDLFAGMKTLGEGLDVALLPISGWGPRVGRGHLDPRRAAQAAAMLRPRKVVPIHWGTLLRADMERRARDLDEPARRFVDQLAGLAPGVSPEVLSPGESLDLGSS